jgi:hypothetical protein
MRSLLQDFTSVIFDLQLALMDLKQYRRQVRSAWFVVKAHSHQSHGPPRPQPTS